MSMPGLVAQPPTNPGGMTCLLRGFLKFLKYTIPTGFRILHGFHYPDLHPGLQIWHAYGISIQVRQAIKGKKLQTRRSLNVHRTHNNEWNTTPAGIVQTFSASSFYSCLAQMTLFIRR